MGGWDGDRVGWWEGGMVGGWDGGRMGWWDVGTERKYGGMMRWDNEVR